MDFKVLSKEIYSATGWMKFIAWFTILVSVGATLISFGTGIIFFGITFMYALKLKQAADAFNKLSNAHTEVDGALIFHEALGHLKSSFMFMGISIIVWLMLIFGGLAFTYFSF